MVEYTRTVYTYNIQANPGEAPAAQFSQSLFIDYPVIYINKSTTTLLDAMELNTVN